MIRRHGFFIAILIAVAVARLAILFLSQTHVHSDEAIIGLMGKHILEGRYFPFYMYGQAYNAAAAWEAYLAVIPFAVFGIGVIPLKSCIVVLSLAGLALFYRMAHLLYGGRTTLLATIVFALIPSLLKWHFQVRGYSWFFLSIPVLTILFWSIWSSQNPKTNRVLLFGLASGLSLWGLELCVTLVAALWMLLILRRNLSWKGFALMTTGLLAGYGPAIAFNLTHHFSNWQAVAADKIRGGELLSLLHPGTLAEILFQEMPKFFGPDTVLWYYAERPLSGFVFYFIVLLAIGAAIWSVLKKPSHILFALRGEQTVESKDFLILILTAACFVPYLTAPLRVPGYFLGGCFFLALLVGRLLARLSDSPKIFPRVAGFSLLTAVVIVGLTVNIDVARHNQIETLIPCEDGKRFCMTRIPGRDLECIEQHLRDQHISSVWTSISFVYPLLFESGESLAVSDAIFGDDVRAFPPAIPWRMPKNDYETAFVIESSSPFRRAVEMRCSAASGGPPLISSCGPLIFLAIRPGT